MKTLTTKELTLAAGQACRQLGNGFRAVVVPADSVDSDAFRSKNGFRPNNDEPGRFFWKGEVTVKTVTVTLQHSVHKGAEMHHAFATNGYDYIIAGVADFGGMDHEIEQLAIAQWVKDHQRDLNEGLSLADFEEKEVILNLTQHQATPEQVEAGVVEPQTEHFTEDQGKAVSELLTFDKIPTAEEMKARAKKLAELALFTHCKKAMIGGAPFFMATLERALIDAGVTPVYAFSVRDSKEEPDGNGGVRKVNVFKHVGFVEA